MYPVFMHGTISFHSGSTKKFLKALQKGEKDAVYYLKSSTGDREDEHTSGTSEKEVSISVPGLSAFNLDPEKPMHRKLWDILVYTTVRALRKKTLIFELHNNLEMKLHVSLIVQPEVPKVKRRKRVLQDRASSRGSGSSEPDEGIEL